MAGGGGNRETYPLTFPLLTKPCRMATSSAARSPPRISTAQLLWYACHPSTVKLSWVPFLPWASRTVKAIDRMVRMVADPCTMARVQG